MEGTVKGELIGTIATPVYVFKDLYMTHTKS